MTRLKVFVFDHLATAAPSGRLPQSLRRQDAMLVQALLADLGALLDIEVVTAMRTDAVQHPPGGMATPAADAVASAVADEIADEMPERHAGTAGQASPATYPQADAAMAPDAARHAVQDSGHPPANGQYPGQLPGAATDARSRPPAGAHRFGPHFAAGLLAADAVWPLARESEGVLEHLSRGVLRGKRVLLGSAPGAIDVAASKLRLARVLLDGGVAAVPAYSPHASLPQDGGPWVVKPDDGAGCLDTRLFNDRATALAWIRASAVDRYVLQPFVAGKLGSLSLLCCDGSARVLACNQERVAMRDNRFHFLGSVVNGLADDDGALARLGQQVAGAIPSLWGYVGVDFVLTAQGAVVIDVNPRLTAAYAGLHASIGCNPAGLVLDLLKGPAAMLAPLPLHRPVSVDVGIT